MRFFKGLNLPKKQETKKPARAYHAGAYPEWSSYNYESLAREGFSKNVVAYRAISLISKCISSISFIITEENRDVYNLFKKPNERQSISIFLEAMANYLLLSGNSYIYISRQPLEMELLRPDRVEIVLNANNTAIDHFLYKINGKAIKIMDTENVIHLRFFNPLNDWYGFSPLQAAAQSVDQHNAVSNHNLSILQNGGRPSGCLMIKNGAENLNDQQRERLRESITETYAGMKNAGRIAILEGDFEWKEIGKSPKDLDFNTGKNVTAREIAQAYGVPPMLMGIEGDSTFSNYKEARFHLWEDTILPLADYFQNEINNWLLENISPNVQIKIDIDKISALYVKRDAIWNRIAECDFLTTSEKREFLGLPPMNT